MTNGKQSLEERVKALEEREALVASLVGLSALKHSKPNEKPSELKRPVAVEEHAQLLKEVDILNYLVWASIRCNGTVLAQVATFINQAISDLELSKSTDLGKAELYEFLNECLVFIRSVSPPRR